MKAVQPYSLPLTEAQFRRALSTGHGRAMQHVLQYGATRCEDAILDAVLHNRVWDPQCESDRAAWLADLVGEADLARAAVNAILAASTEPLDRDNFFDRDQQSAIAGNLALKGVPGAREALFAMFQPAADSGDVLGLEAIIEIDGSEGLLFACRAIGRLAGNDPSFPVSQEPLAVFDNRFGEGEARSVLESAAASDRDIWTYVHAIRADDVGEASHEYRKIPASGFDLTGWQSRTKQDAGLSGSEVIALARNAEDPQTPDSFRSWGRQASSEDLELVMDAILSEKDSLVIGRLLKCFFRRAFPRFDRGLVRLLNIVDERIHYDVIAGLSQLSDPDVRQLAFYRLWGGFLRDGLRLLKSNFLASDVKVLEQVINLPTDPNECHWILGDLIHLFEANPPPEDSTGLLLFAYEHSPCMNCRWKAVKLLLSQPASPAWVVQECRYDGSEEIRELVSAG